MRAAERDDAEVVDLAHARDGQRGGVRALAQRRLVCRGSTWTTTSLPGQRPLELGLDPVRGRVALTDRGARRDGDHDVGELPPAGLAHAQPAQLRPAARSPAIAARAAASASAGARSISTSTFRRISRAGGERARAAATKSAATESPSG